MATRKEVKMKCRLCDGTGGRPGDSANTDCKGYCHNCGGRKYAVKWLLKHDDKYIDVDYAYVFSQKDAFKFDSSLAAGLNSLSPKHIHRDGLRIVCMKLKG